jgi:hypothetical protein
MPSRRARVTSTARRPLREVVEVLSTPEADSSLTMFDTVAGESPVEPASSTCVRWPWRFRESTMRARLASRNEVCEPGVGFRLATGTLYRRSRESPRVTSEIGVSNHKY